MISTCRTGVPTKQCRKGGRAATILLLMVLLVAPAALLGGAEAKGGRSRKRRSGSGGGSGASVVMARPPRKQAPAPAPGRAASTASSSSSTVGTANTRPSTRSKSRRSAAKTLTSSNPRVDMKNGVYNGGEGHSGNKAIMACTGNCGAHGTAVSSPQSKSVTGRVQGPVAGGVAVYGLHFNYGDDSDTYCPGRGPIDMESGESSSFISTLGSLFRPQWSLVRIAELPIPPDHSSCIHLEADLEAENYGTRLQQLLRYDVDCCAETNAEHPTCEDEEHKARSDSGLSFWVRIVIWALVAICVGMVGGAFVSEESGDQATGVMVGCVSIGLGIILVLLAAGVIPKYADDQDCEGTFSTCDPGCEAMLGRTWTESTFPICLRACNGAPRRSWTETQARTGDGHSCPCVYECVSAEDVCINECASAPCKNDGICDDQVNDYTCTCLSGFTGTNCDINIDDCPGLNPPRCPSVPIYYARSAGQDLGSTENSKWASIGSWNNNGYCDALSCAFDEADCCTNGQNVSNGTCVRWKLGCTNGGKCIDGINNYSCTCVSGYEGFNCAVDIDECQSNPCQNNASCATASQPDMYTCTCKAGYTGTNCDGDIDECASKPCTNGGSCTDLVANYSCACLAGFMGTRCEADIDECASLPQNYCNNGTCVEGIDSFSCLCQSSWSGLQCQVSTPANSISGVLTLALDIAYVNANLASFHFMFKRDLGAALRINPIQITVSRVAAGSVMVDFVLHPGQDGAAPVSVDALRLLFSRPVSIAASNVSALSDVVAHKNCLGQWQDCTDGCESFLQRNWLQVVAPSGSGIACPDRTIAISCTNGTGACVIRDCVGEWSACTNDCEKSWDRVFSQVVAPAGTGQACPLATDCENGVDCTLEGVPWVTIVIVGVCALFAVICALKAITREDNCCRLCAFGLRRTRVKKRSVRGAKEGIPVELRKIFDYADGRFEQKDGFLSMGECNKLLSELGTPELTEEDFDAAMVVTGNSGEVGLSINEVWDILYDYDTAHVVKDARQLKLTKGVQLTTPECNCRPGKKRRTLASFCKYFIAEQCVCCCRTRARHVSNVVKYISGADGPPRVRAHPSAQRKICVQEFTKASKVGQVDAATSSVAQQIGLQLKQVSGGETCSRIVRIFGSQNGRPLSINGEYRYQGLEYGWPRFQNSQGTCLFRNIARSRWEIGYSKTRGFNVLAYVHAPSGKLPEGESKWQHMCSLGVFQDCAISLELHNLIAAVDHSGSSGSSGSNSATLHRVPIVPARGLQQKKKRKTTRHMSAKSAVQPDDDNVSTFKFAILGMIGRTAIRGRAGARERIQARLRARAKWRTAKLAMKANYTVGLAARAFSDAQRFDMSQWPQIEHQLEAGIEAQTILAMEKSTMGSSNSRAKRDKLLRLLSDTSPEKFSLQDRLECARKLLTGITAEKFESLRERGMPLWKPGADLFYQLEQPNTSIYGQPYEEILVYVSHAWHRPDNWQLQDSWETAKSGQLYAVTQDIFRSPRLCPSQDEDDITLWIDQISSPPPGQDFQTLTSFNFFTLEYLAMIPNMVVILSPNFFERMWCLVEFAGFLVLHDPLDLLLGLDVFTVADDPQATVYPFEVYLEAVKSISITHARCSSSRDRDFLATLVKDNFRSVTTFENFAKLCAFAMLGFNLKTCIEFQTDNDEEDPDGRMCAQFESHFKNLLACVHSMGEIELDSGRAKSTFLELEKGLSKLESGTCHDAANFSGKVEASFTHHVALLLENAKRKALKSDAPLLEYMTVAVDHKRKHFAKARAKRSRRNMTDSLQNNDNRIDRFVGVITMGSGDIAARGIEKQLGISDEHVSYIKSNPMELISWEFGLGTDDWADVMLGFDIDPARTENHRIRDEDTENFRCVKDGTHPDRSVTPLKPGDQEWDVQTMEMLMQHHFIELAELEYHHVFALRLYTTSSYTQINNPLREQIKPHPFAATVFCIKEAVLKLRALHGMMPYKNDKRVYWRGMKDLTVTPEFQREGGTELACVSTSSSKAQAIKFSESEHPLLFKFTSSNFMSRGAEISFLSVYPSEEEVLYPPGTYLAPDEMVDEQIGGKEVQILSVSPSC